MSMEPVCDGILSSKLDYTFSTTAERRHVHKQHNIIYHVLVKCKYGKEKYKLQFINNLINLIITANHCNNRLMMTNNLQAY